MEEAGGGGRGGGLKIAPAPDAHGRARRQASGLEPGAAGPRPRGSEGRGCGGSPGEAPEARRNDTSPIRWPGTVKRAGLYRRPRPRLRAPATSGSPALLLHEGTGLSSGRRREGWALGWLRADGASNLPREAKTGRRKETRNRVESHHRSRNPERKHPLLPQLKKTNRQTKSRDAKAWETATIILEFGLAHSAPAMSVGVVVGLAAGFLQVQNGGRLRP